MRHRETVIQIAERIAGLGYGLWDERDQHYVFVSEQLARPYGLTPEQYVARCQSYADEVGWIHSDDRQRYEAHHRNYLEDPKECSIEFRICSSAERIRHIREFFAPIFDDSGQLIQTVIVELQISELKGAEEALRQAQKMEAVGQLAGGIAHDFNNLLAVIMGNLEILSQRCAGAGDTSEFVDVAMGAAQRGAGLTRRLLALSRKRSAHVESADIGELAEGMLELLRRTLGSEFAIDLHRPADLWRCQIDRGQFENSLLNLTLNARDAMNGGGTLVFDFSNVEFAERYDVVEPAIGAGRYVRLAVTDTGSGMAPETAERAVEPFFTTKQSGAGSGLGLSMVYGFAKQCGGHLCISSQLERGTTVEIFLPKSSDPVFETESDQATGKLPRSNGECVLLVDDDESVLAMTSDLLQSLGYAVEPAQSAHQALGVLETAPRVDLLMTDVMLGGGHSGPELAREVKRRRSDLPVLFVSGFPQQKLEASGFVSPEVPFLAKPFRKAEIARMVRSALERK